MRKPAGPGLVHEGVSRRASRARTASGLRAAARRASRGRPRRRKPAPPTATPLIPSRVGQHEVHVIVRTGVAAHGATVTCALVAAQHDGRRDATKSGVPRPPHYRLRARGRRRRSGPPALLDRLHDVRRDPPGRTTVVFTTTSFCAPSRARSLAARRPRRPAARPRGGALPGVDVRDERRVHALPGAERHADAGPWPRRTRAAGTRSAPRRRASGRPRRSFPCLVLHEAVHPDLGGLGLGLREALQAPLLLHGLLLLLETLDFRLSSSLLLEARLVQVLAFLRLSYAIVPPPRTASLRASLAPRHGLPWRPRRGR